MSFQEKLVYTHLEVLQKAVMDLQAESDALAWGVVIIGLVQAVLIAFLIIWK